MTQRLAWLALVTLVWTGMAVPAFRSLQAQNTAEDINIDRTAVGPRFEPVSLEGITGEAASVLRFDLEVQGFEFTTPDKARFNINGSSGASLLGRVTDRVNGAVLFSKEYTGGSVRAQAHKLADEIVALLPGRRGIAGYKIAFRVEAGKNSEIYVADYDGYNAVAVTRDNTIARDPAWLPGRRTLYYTSYKTGAPFLYQHDLQTGVRKLVAGFPGMNSAAALSPDGRRLAMILSKSGSPDLFVANADGSGLVQVTHTKEDESSPCWSPDGTRLCVVSRISGWPALYIVPAGGGTLRRHSTAGVSNPTEPSWSPDGRTIAFTSSIGGFQICTVPAAGGEVSVLAAGEDPSWAPNSRTILFTRRTGGRRVLSLLDVPTKRVKDVRQISGNCSQPDWAR